MNNIIDFQQKSRTENLTGQTLFSKMLEGEAPHTLIIACSDPYSMPRSLDNLTGKCSLIIQNPGALVPPYGSGNSEFLCNLNYSIEHFLVKNIVVIGHNSCMFLKSVLEADYINHKNFAWIKEIVQESGAEDDHIGRALVFHSCRNLLEYPMLSTGVSRPGLNVYGWYYASEINNVDFVYELEKLDECFIFQ